MSAIPELKTIQKRNLHQLLMIRKELGDRKSRYLEEYINVAKAEMDAEDFAYVQKTIEELQGQ